MNLRGPFLLVLAALLLVVAACSSNGSSSTSPSSAATASRLAERTVQSGEVEVKIEPNRIDDDGADIKLTFDTHSVELDADLPSAAHLSVDGTEWTSARWDGDEPGGHHREGRITYEPAGPARGEAVLTIDELPEPVEVSWDLP